MKNGIYTLSKQEEYLATCIVQAALNVHKELGPGLLEKIYEACFVYELNKMGIKTERQVQVFIKYDGHELDEGFRMDVLVDDLIPIELKAAEGHNALWEAQAISHMKLAFRNLSFLINFNVPLIKHGIKRFVNFKKLEEDAQKAKGDWFR